MKKDEMVRGYKNLIKKIIENTSLTKEDIYDQLSQKLEEKPFLEEFQTAFEQLYYGDELIAKNVPSSVNGLIDITYHFKSEGIS